jgi:antitoxin VapB
MKTAKIFKNGQSQAVRLPKEFRLQGKEVFIKKEGQSIILIPIEKNIWDSWYKNIHKFSEDFMVNRAQPIVQQNRDDIF